MAGIMIYKTDSAAVLCFVLSGFLAVPSYHVVPFVWFSATLLLPPDAIPLYPFCQGAKGNMFVLYDEPK